MSYIAVGALFGLAVFVCGPALRWLFNWLAERAGQPDHDQEEP